MRINGKEVKFWGNYQWTSKELKKRFQVLDISCLVVLAAWVFYVTNNMDQFTISVVIGLGIIVVMQTLMTKIKKADKAMKRKE